MAIGLNFLKKVLETSCKSLYKFLDLLLETTNNNLQGRFTMNKPVNYKEIEEFAKSINLDVKYLLGEFYKENLDLRSLKSLPENTTFNVGGTLVLNSLKKLPENITFNVGGYLWLVSLKSLPANITFNVGGYLDLNSLKSLPANITFNVGGYLGLSSLKELPENITFNVGGELWLDSLKSLPENITFNVGRNLYINSLKSLSNSYNISLKGGIYIEDKDILSKVVYKKLAEDDIMYFENGFILVDGIYCKVLKNHEGIKKCQYLGSTKEFYIVSSNGKHSHGETIEEAKKDLIYKISNRDKSSYKNLTKTSILSFEEAVECYRVITGACFFGTKNFIETFNVPQKDYSIKEIIKLTQNQYGSNTFKNFFK